MRFKAGLLLPILSIVIHSFSSFAIPDGDEAALLHRQVGQMVLAGFKGTTPEDPQVQAVARAISEDRLGGVILFRHNIASPTQLKTLTSFLHRSSGTRPLFIAVDQEGGRVQRLTKERGFTDYFSHEEIARKNFSFDQALDHYREMAQELKHYGINLNLAPVVDLSVNKNSRIIAKYERSFSSDPRVVWAYASAFIRAHREAGVLTSIKHWPGHGSAAEDSHLGIVDVTYTWSSDEKGPYAQLISSGDVDAVMTAHVFHRGLDKDKPATLSPIIIQGILRGQLKFDGVVFTDCLQMGAITSLFGQGKTEDAALQAIDAGADVMVVSNFHLDDLDLVDRLFAKVEMRILEGDMHLKARLEESNFRITQLKKRLAVEAGHDEL
jgi:beta-N-acetylhexosaminidase